MGLKSGHPPCGLTTVAWLAWLPLNSAFWGNASPVTPSLSTAFLSKERQGRIEDSRNRLHPLAPASSQRRSCTALHARSLEGAGGFSSESDYATFLEEEGKLPRGFRVGTAWISFVPVEVPFPSRMNVTVIALDEPTADFAAVFTKNAFPGAPVKVGRKRVAEPLLQAIIVNNKVSNVCPGGEGSDGGVGDAELVCQATAQALGLPSASYVIPSSTGVIGWRLPYKAIIETLPKVVATLQSSSVVPAARGIITTDRYPKIRSVSIAGGRIVALAKGAGMIEPNLATMLVYVLTDLAVPRDVLREWLPDVVSKSFNCISVDSDTSTSDTVLVVSSSKVPVSTSDYDGVKAALTQVCAKLAEDIVRNGEGTNHVIEVKVTNAPSLRVARGLGRAVVNSPLLKCAIAGNDPNVGRLLAAVGKYLGANDVDLPLEGVRLKMGGVVVFSGGRFELSPEKEKILVEHMKQAQLIPGAMKAGDSVTPVPFPPHERNVQLEVDLAQKDGFPSLTIFGSDLTYDYVTENADYRS